MASDVPTGSDAPNQTRVDYSLPIGRCDRAVPVHTHANASTFFGGTDGGTASQEILEKI